MVLVAVLAAAAEEEPVLLAQEVSLPITTDLVLAAAEYFPALEVQEVLVVAVLADLQMPLVVSEIPITAVVAEAGALLAGAEEALVGVLSI
jgi:hypothetical protein